jgi:hypothetical protein
MFVKDALALGNICFRPNFTCGDVIKRGNDSGRTRLHNLD